MSVVTPAEHPFAGVLDRLYLACIWAAAISIATMSVIIPIGVVMRYFFGVGARWPEPIAILLMIVFTFLGAAAAYRAGAHIAVELFTELMPPAARRLAAKLVDGLMLLVCGFVAWFGGRLCLETMGQSVAELPWLPVGVTYLAIPIGAAVTLLFVLEHLLFGTQARRPVVAFGEAA